MQELGQSVAAWELEGASLFSVLRLTELDFESEDEAVCAVASQQAVLRLLARGLTRRQPHVLITGDEGIGKSSVLRLLAQTAHTGQWPMLEGKRFLVADCRFLSPENTRAALEGLFTELAQHPDVVLCLEGLVELLTRPQGQTNRQALRAALELTGLPVIGVLNTWEYHEHIASDPQWRDLFTRVELTEPSREETRQILDFTRTRLQEEFDCEIPEAVLDRTITLTDSYLLNEHFPTKAIRVLERACEDRAYSRREDETVSATLTLDDVLKVMADRTGIAKDTLNGTAEHCDYQAALACEVYGQDEVVRAVANELRLIKSGLNEPGKPATVLLFAGLTGVGKTELAKQLAKLYSSSKRLETYTMGNFTEPHSVSGIIGVPPGYVGHEHGGRLINDLNTDPYSVFLLDEAEKAHPNVLKPFLNLFDEGWIIDQRGIKAHADRAIFILTTNAGDRAITQMTQSGKTEEEIVERVKQTLSRLRHERSSQPTFPPQFLSRIKKVLVFRPLNEAAMIDITKKLLKQIQHHWQQKREKQIEVTEELTQALGQHAHQLNEKTGGKEGGRIVRKTLSDLIETNIQNASLSQPDEYKQATTIRCSMAESSIGQKAEKPIVSPPNVTVAFSQHNQKG